MHDEIATKESLIREVHNTAEALKTNYPFILPDIKRIAIDDHAQRKALLIILEDLHKLQEAAKEAAKAFAELEANAQKYQDEEGYQNDLGKIMKETSTLTTGLTTYKSNFEKIAALICAYNEKVQLRTYEQSARNSYENACKNALAIGLPIIKLTPPTTTEKRLSALAEMTLALHSCIVSLDEELLEKIRIGPLLTADENTHLKSVLATLVKALKEKSAQEVEGCIVTSDEISTLHIINDETTPLFTHLTKAKALLAIRRTPAQPKSNEEFLRLQGVEAQKKALKEGIFKRFFGGYSETFKALVETLIVDKEKIKLDEGVIITIVQLLESEKKSHPGLYERFTAAYKRKK